jgi:kynurenine--oxoglutarate transaminase/cysteine-S-conjugate beta-lyase/glutamine--phenylpyruvate transaminase
VCQGAIARSLKIAVEPYLECRDYYEWINNQYIAKREILIRILRETNAIKIQPLLSEGGFFLCGRILDGGDYIPDKYKEGASLDFAFCRWITETLKISAIPCSAFFSQENKHYGEGLVRFALCKGYDDYEKVEKILLG